MLRMKFNKEVYYIVRNKHTVSWFKGKQHEAPQTTLDEINHKLGTNYQFMTKHKYCRPVKWTPQHPSFPFFL